MYVYIYADHLERNYSGPTLIQLVEIHSDLWKTFETIRRDTKLSLTVNFELLCQEEDRTKSESYTFGVEKINFKIIDNPDDITFLKKFFGTNFNTFDFMSAIFSQDLLDSYDYNCVTANDMLTNCEIYSNSIKTIPTDTSNLFIFYSGNLDNTLLFSYSFDQQIIADFKQALKRNYSYPRSLDNTLWLPMIELQNFKFYTFEHIVADRLESVLNKYEIILENYNIVKYEYEEVFDDEKQDR